MAERQASILLTVTPGRSGSVFLADVLERSLGRQAEITHERLGPQHTLPRVFFHAFDEPRRSQLAAFPPVAAFLRVVEQRLERGTTIVEVGMFSSHLIPVLADRFGSRLRVLSLFRHPLITAASHSTRGMYHSWPHWTFFSLGNVTPFDPGMQATGFRDRWAAMSPFERNLYAWVEYALLWQAIRNRHPDVPALEIKSEELFADPATWCRRAAAFAGLEGDIVLSGTRKNELEGKSTLRFGLEEDWPKKVNHPELMAIAESMGYRLDDPGVLSSMKKYEAPRAPMYRLLNRAGWFSAKGYVRRITRPRFWRYYSRWRALRRAYPEYFRIMFGAS